MKYVRMAACILFFSCNRRSSKEIDLKLIRVNDSSNYVKQALEFISEVSKKELADRSMILEDKPISPDDLDCLTNAREDSVNFTKLERDSLLQKAQTSFIHFWTSLYFPNSRIVSADTVRSIFNDHSKGWNYFYSHIGRRIYSFSAPMFFRANKYCLFYSQYACGWLCAEGSLGLYQKIDGHWQLIKTYYQWVS